MTALFLRHEGYLGAVGCFLKAHPIEAAEVTHQGDTPKVCPLQPDLFPPMSSSPKTACLWPPAAVSCKGLVRGIPLAGCS